MRCALCRGRTPGRFKTLCTRCHFVKEAMQHHGVEPVLTAIRRSIRELRSDRISTQLPPSQTSSMRGGGSIGTPVNGTGSAVTGSAAASGPEVVAPPQRRNRKSGRVGGVSPQPESATPGPIAEEPSQPPARRAHAWSDPVADTAPDSVPTSTGHGQGQGGRHAVGNASPVRPAVGPATAAKGDTLAPPSPGAAARQGAGSTSTANPNEKPDQQAPQPPSVPSSSAQAGDEATAASADHPAADTSAGTSGHVAERPGSGAAAAPVALGTKLREVYIVKHAFEATEEKQLTVAKGDIITIRAKHPHGWWQGVLEDGRRGWVPGEFLRPMKEPTPATLPPVAEAVAPSEGTEADPSNTQDGTANVAAAATPTSGDVAAAAAASNTAETDGTGDDTGALYYAKYPFEAQQPRQLTLKRNDVVRVRAEKPSGWWQVDLLDETLAKVEATGWVPGRFLRKRKSASSEAVAAAQPAAGKTDTQASSTGAEDAEGSMVTSVTFFKRDGQGLGIGIGGGKFDQESGIVTPIFINKLLPDSVAAQSKRVRVGDVLLGVNGVSLEGKEKPEVVEVLKSMPDKVTFDVRHNIKLERKISRRHMTRSKEAEVDHASTDATTAAASAAKRVAGGVESENSATGNDIELVLNVDKGCGESLGFGVSGGAGGSSGKPLTVRRVVPHGVAARAGLEKGDVILRMNSVSFEGCTHEQAVGHLKTFIDVMQLEIHAVRRVRRRQSGTPSMASNNSNSNMTMMEDGHNGSAGIQRAAEGSEAVHVQITPSSSPSKKLATYYEDDEEDLPLGFGSMITEVGEMQEVRDTAEEHARQENATASPQLSHSDTAVDSANSDGMSSTERNSETGERDSSDGKDPIVSVDEQQRLDDEDAFERAWSTHEQDSPERRSAELRQYQQQAVKREEERASQRASRTASVGELDVPAGDDQAVLPPPPPPPPVAEMEEEAAAEQEATTDQEAATERDQVVATLPPVQVDESLSVQPDDAHPRDKERATSAAVDVPQHETDTSQQPLADKPDAAEESAEGSCSEDDGDDLFPDDDQLDLLEDGAKADAVPKDSTEPAPQSDLPLSGDTVAQPAADHAEARQQQEATEPPADFARECAPELMETASEEPSVPPAMDSAVEAPIKTTEGPTDDSVVDPAAGSAESSESVAAVSEDAAVQAQSAAEQSEEHTQQQATEPVAAVVTEQTSEVAVEATEKPVPAAEEVTEERTRPTAESAQEVGGDHEAQPAVENPTQHAVGHEQQLPTGAAPQQAAVEVTQEPTTEPASNSAVEDSVVESAAASAESNEAVGDAAAQPAVDHPEEHAEQRATAEPVAADVTEPDAAVEATEEPVPAAEEVTGEVVPVSAVDVSADPAAAAVAHVAQLPAAPAEEEVAEPTPAVAVEAEEHAVKSSAQPATAPTASEEAEPTPERAGATLDAETDSVIEAPPEVIATPIADVTAEPVAATAEVTPTEQSTEAVAESPADLSGDVAAAPAVNDVREEPEQPVAEPADSAVGSASSAQAIPETHAAPEPQADDVTEADVSQTDAAAKGTADHAQQETGTEPEPPAGAELDNTLEASTEQDQETSTEQAQEVSPEAELAPAAEAEQAHEQAPTEPELPADATAALPSAPDVTAEIKDVAVPAATAVPQTAPTPAAETAPVGDSLPLPAEPPLPPVLPETEPAQSPAEQPLSEAQPELPPAEPPLPPAEPPLPPAEPPLPPAEPPAVSAPPPPNTAPYRDSLAGDVLETMQAQLDTMLAGNSSSAPPSAAPSAAPSWAPNTPSQLASSSSSSPAPTPDAAATPEDRQANAKQRAAEARARAKDEARKRAKEFLERRKKGVVPST